jgi:hypothetical protein
MATIGYQTLQDAVGKPSMPPAQPMLCGINDELCKSGEDFAGLATRLHILADRLIGTRPEAVEKNSAENAPSSQIQTFERNVKMLGNVRAHLCDAVERLERL